MVSFHLNEERIFSVMIPDLLLFLGLLALAGFGYLVLRRKKGREQIPAEQVEANFSVPVQKTRTEADSASFFNALSKSRSQFSKNLKDLFSGGLDNVVREDLESLLLSSDVGVDTTDWILETLTSRASAQKVTDSQDLLLLLKNILTEILEPLDESVDAGSVKPFVVLMIGVNGAGKTTTIGKLAYKFKQEGKTVLLAAGDTFRAAAVEQLKTWGERNSVPVISQGTGADSASVIYDACESAVARGIDVVLADTAGRLQNKTNLMGELEKIGRVLGKLGVGAPHEVLLVLDAGTGQNAISQAREFAKVIKPTGLVLTKLDGTAKGGVIFALAREFRLPIRYVGLGEKIEDLRLFDRQLFIEALFSGTSG